MAELELLETNDVDPGVRQPVRGSRAEATEPDHSDFVTVGPALVHAARG
jgi:hypothetical protein